MVARQRSRPVPAGWPAAVSPPGSGDLQATATAWLLGLMPELGQYTALQQEPVILAFLARNVLSGAVEGAREGYRTTRGELRGLVPAPAIAAALGDFRTEGRRLSAALKAVELVEWALRGKLPGDAPVAGSIRSRWGGWRR